MSNQFIQMQRVDAEAPIAAKHIAQIHQMEDGRFRVILLIANGRRPYSSYSTSMLGIFNEIYDAVNEAKCNASLIEFSDDII